MTRSQPLYLIKMVTVTGLIIVEGVAKVRPSKDFLRPLCQLMDAQHISL